MDDDSTHLSIMALRGDSGWQMEKTLAECMRYTFDNEIAADVTFEVGPPGGATVNIRAHKVIRISRCEVFQAMFSSGMTESNSSRVRVEDIDADTFKELLLYIYSEVVSVNFETAPSLVYAARKYMLPKLVRKCGVCLSEGLNVSNVIQVLDTSFIIEDTELESQCLQLIVEEARSVFAGTEILSASPQSMETILQMNRILIKETVIYETCIAWAKHQHRLNNSIEDHPTDQQIREILGDLLYKIRFPVMEVTEFAAITENKSILTPEEKMSIFYYLATKANGSQLRFSTERRRFDKEVWIQRSVTRVDGNWYSATAVDAIDFTSTQDIILTGIGLYTGYPGIGYEVDVEILRSTQSLFKKKLRVLSTKDESQVKVSVNEPIFMKAGVLYSVTALCHGNICHFAQLCTPVCTTSNVTFSFSPSHHSHRTNHFHGQIPRLYFLL